MCMTSRPEITPVSEHKFGSTELQGPLEAGNIIGALTTKDYWKGPKKEVKTSDTKTRDFDEIMMNNVSVNVIELEYFNVHIYNIK